MFTEAANNAATDCALLVYINEVQLTDENSSTLAGKILDQYHNLFSQGGKTLVHITHISHCILPFP